MKLEIRPAGEGWVLRWGHTSTLIEPLRWCSEVLKLGYRVNTHCQHRLTEAFKNITLHVGTRQQWG